MEYQKEMNLKVLRKVNELGKVSVKEFIDYFPPDKEPHLVFFYSSSEKGDFLKTTADSGDPFLYFYELSEKGKRKLMILEFEKKIDSSKMSFRRRALAIAIAAGVGVGIAAWPSIFPLV